MKPLFFGLSAIVLCAALALPLATWAKSPQGISLSFNANVVSPAVVTHFSIEQPLAPVPVDLIAGTADILFPRIGGGSALSTPKDKNRDGIWTISAQWVDLGTDKAWRASVDVPVKDLNIGFSFYTVLVVFGPNGELLIGSDKIGPSAANRVDVARSCGVRVPEADKNWRRETGHLPEMPDVMAFRAANLAKASAKSFCRPPQGE